MYVAIEGIDGSGKSTLAGALGRWFADATLLREPSAFGEDFKRLVLDKNTCETARMFMFLADRAVLAPPSERLRTARLPIVNQRPPEVASILLAAAPCKIISRYRRQNGRRGWLELAFE